MALALEKQDIPLVTDPDGVMRVAGSRVTLDVVVAGGAQTLSRVAQRSHTSTRATAHGDDAVDGCNPMAAVILDDHSVVEPDGSTERSG